MQNFLPPLKLWLSDLSFYQYSPRSVTWMCEVRWEKRYLLWLRTGTFSVLNLEPHHKGSEQCLSSASPLINVCLSLFSRSGIFSVFSWPAFCKTYCCRWALTEIHTFSWKLRQLPSVEVLSVYFSLQNSGWKNKWRIIHMYLFIAFRLHSPGSGCFDQLFWH